MKKLFNEEQIKYIVSNYEYMTYKEIGENIGGYKPEQIAGWLSNNGYKKSNRSIFTKSDMDYMSKNYVNKTYKEIAHDLGFAEQQVRGWINHNCNSKLRDFDKDYFKSIDSSNKAYWLGFIFADGSIQYNAEKRNYELSIELNKDDAKLLYDFNRELGNAHDIKFRHREKYICDYPEPSVTDSAILRVYSKDIVEGLISHGVVPDKTNNIVYPKLENYFFDFLRGYIDGDGCVYINKSNHLYVHITSSFIEVFEYLQSKLSEYSISSSIYKEKERKYRLCFYGSNAESLLDLIYYDEHIQKLDRKYNKYLSYKNGLPN